MVVGLFADFAAAETVAVIGAASDANGLNFDFGFGRWNGLFDGLTDDFALAAVAEIAAAATDSDSADSSNPH